MNTNAQNPSAVPSTASLLDILPAADTPTDQPARAKRKTRRNGRIARLPKLERDMVGRMLRDGVPYKRVVDVLKERKITVSQRNISNFMTRGGYEDWLLEQEHLLDTHLTREALSGDLAKDPNKLPELGLQLMATRFSKHLLRPDVQRAIETHPERFFNLVSALCRLSKELLSLQRFRDLRQTPGNPGHNAEGASSSFPSIVRSCPQS